jgi:hypothetical protein
MLGMCLAHIEIRYRNSITVMDITEKKEVTIMTETNKAYPEDDPRHHTAKIKGMLDELIRHLREDTSKVDEPKAQAVFETTAEVLTGLKTAFEHYERGSEAAMTEPKS